MRRGRVWIGRRIISDPPNGVRRLGTQAVRRQRPRSGTVVQTGDGSRAGSKGSAPRKGPPPPAKEK